MLGICSLSVLVLHKTLLVPLLMYGSETILWKEECSRIRAVQMNNLGGLLGIRRMDRDPICTDKGVVWSEEGFRRKD